MIIDCFQFFDELDLLEIRVNELKDVVDVFVLTESPYTFTGIKKPLYFKDNKDRFKEFNIVHTVFNPKKRYEKPPVFEKYQKQYNIDSAFEIFNKGDILIQGDVDEIPKASAVKMAVDTGLSSVRLEQTLFYYYMNCKCIGRPKKFKNSRVLRPEGWFPYNARQTDKTDKTLRDTGWHFSFLGDIQKKLEAWGHAPEYNKPPYNTKEHILKCITEGKDLFKRKRYKFEFLNDLSYLPQYALNNLDKFDKHIWTQQ